MKNKIMYKKHDSFFALQHIKKVKKITHIMDRINKTSRNTSITKKLSLDHKKLITKVIQDLSDNSDSSSKIIPGAKCREVFEGLSGYNTKGIPYKTWREAPDSF